MSSEIKLYQQDADLQRYPKREVEIYEALKTDLISVLKDEDLYDLFNNVIAKAYVISSYSPPEPVAFSLIVNETMKKYKNSFGFIRKAEIELIFSRGLSKEYGDFMGLSFITFVDWARAYAKDLVRIKLTTLVKEKVIPSDEEIYQLSKTNALTAFNEAKSKGTVGRFGVVVYDFLEKAGILNLDQEEKNAFWKKAKNEYSQFLIMSKSNPVDLAEKKKLERDYESYLEGGKTDRLIVISKRLIVDDCFAKMIFAGDELSELLTK